jgi:hypothetical protein
MLPTIASFAQAFHRHFFLHTLCSAIRHLSIVQSWCCTICSKCLDSTFDISCGLYHLFLCQWQHSPHCHLPHCVVFFPQFLHLKVAGPRRLKILRATGKSLKVYLSSDFLSFSRLSSRELSLFFSPLNICKSMLYLFVFCLSPEKSAALVLRE